MKNTFELQDVIVDLAEEFKTNHGCIKKKEQEKPENMFEGFLKHDKVLESLYKDHEDTKAYANKLAKELGEDDPMTLVAMDMLDTTVSALETRLIELKQNKTLCRTIKKQVAPKEYKETCRRARRIKRVHHYQEMARRRAEMIEKAKKAGEESFFFVLFMMNILKIGLDNTQKQLSIAQSFALASTPREDLTVRQIA